MIGVIIVIALILFIIISLALSKKKKDTPSDTFSDAHQLAESARLRTEQQLQKQKNEPIVKPVQERKPRPIPSRPAPISREEYKQIERDNETRTLREAGIEAAEIPFSQIIYDTSIGYGGELITYNTRKQQFYIHEFMWHIDDGIEYLDTKMCSPEEAVSIIQKCSHKEEYKAPALERIAELIGTGLTEAENNTGSVSEDDRKRIEAIADRASFGFDPDRLTDVPQIILEGRSSGTGPYHEEYLFGYDVTEEEYIFSEYVRAPMAYCGGWEVLRVKKEEIRSEEELQILKNAMVRRWGK